jgi:hypothetical protein
MDITLSVVETNDTRNFGRNADTQLLQGQIALPEMDESIAFCLAVGLL